MNRTLYFFGNLFLGLSVVAGLLQSILYLFVGSRVVFMGPFMGWFLVTSITVFAASVIGIKYYRYKGYEFAYYSAIVVTTLSALLAIILCLMLNSAPLRGAYLICVCLTMVAAIVYCFSLIVPPAGNNKWLKAAGVAGAIITAVLLGGLIWSFIDPTLQTNGTMEKIDQWTSFFRSFIPVFFILQFSAESKLLTGVDAPIGRSRTKEDLLGYLGLLLVGGILVFGFMMSKETFWSLHWDKHNLAKAQELVEKSERRSFAGTNGDTLSYLLMKPLDYDSTLKYPLVVCLPYGGYQAPAAQLLSSDVNRKKYPAFLFTPYNQPGSSWGGVPGRSAKDELVFEALAALKEPGLDRNRIYVSGVSLGGYGSWQLISVHPEMFAAAVPVCGAGDPKLAANVADIPVWAFHGAKDRNVPVSGSRDMIAAIKRAGGEPRYTEFPDEAHNIWHQVTITPGLLDWLFAQKKE